MSAQHVVSALSRRGILASVAALAACGRFAPAAAPAQTTGQHVTDPLAQRFYAARGGRLAWDQGSVQALNRIVGGAQAHGLDPTAFAPKRLEGLSEDEAVTVAALAYAKALASGFVAPGTIEPVFTLATNGADVAAGLSQALGQPGGLEPWYASLPPQDAEYRALSSAYLATLGQGRAPAAPAATNAASANAASANAASANAVSAASPTGAAPPAPQTPTRQLAANLERRRWLTRTPPVHRIDVNTAGAFLDYMRPGQAPFTARTVVGRADHATPSIQAAFHRLVANPPWRVPDGIAKKEILPKGAAYMARQDMHVENGLVVQSPGPKSALGLVKFDVEDTYDIYLHDTPAKSLFALPERHRSHGCVRVQNAVAFARSLAAETGKADAFDAALASKATTQVELGQSIAVRMLYHTAYLDASGQVVLAPDTYGTDETLAAALGLGQANAAAHTTEPDILFGP